MDTHDTYDNNDEQPADEIRVCSDCQGDFILTAGERKFFQAKGLHLPRRCQACRRQRSMVAPRDLSVWKE